METDNAALFERVQEVDPSLADEENLPPICKVWEWFLDANKRIVARRWADHPTLGSGPNRAHDYIITTTVMWISHEIGMARTKNTLYQLMEAPSR